MSTQSRNDAHRMDPAGTAVAREQAWPGPVYTPAVDIFETDHAITVLADMPGVKAKDLKIDLREGVLTLTGRVMPGDGSSRAVVLQEYDAGTFFREFTLGEMIEQSGIDAKLIDGVLRLELPKVEAARPRQIVVRTG